MKITIIAALLVLPTLIALGDPPASSPIAIGVPKYGVAVQNGNGEEFFDGGSRGLKFTYDVQDPDTKKNITIPSQVNEHLHRTLDATCIIQTTGTDGKVSASATTIRLVNQDHEEKPMTQVNANGQFIDHIGVDVLQYLTALKANLPAGATLKPSSTVTFVWQTTNHTYSVTPPSGGEAKPLDGTFSHTVTITIDLTEDGKYKDINSGPTGN